MTFRISIPDFSLANPMYVGASVSLFLVGDDGLSSGVLATVYAGPTGSITAANPQTLDSEGKFAYPVYIETPVIAEVIGATVGTHVTGAIGVRGTWRGGWTTGTVYYSTDIIEDPVSRDLYVATMDYTSGATLAEDVADGSLQFQLYAVAAVATSATSNSIGTGSKVFATQANRQFGFGQTLVIVDRADAANFMIGKVTSYVGETLTVGVTLIGGSGTKTDWEISISGPAGAAGNGVPTGGATGQVLQKASGTDYATSWLTLGAAASKALGADITFDASLNLTSRTVPSQKTADYSLEAADRNKLFYFFITAASATATCLDAATAGSGYTVKFVNQFASTKPLILAVASGPAFYHPNGSNSPTITLQPGESCAIYSSGGVYFVLELVRNKTAIQGGFKNLKIVAPDGTTAPVVTADQVTVEDAGGRAMRLSSLNVTMNLGTTGAGGLDAGGITAAKMYFIWAIAKEDGTQSALASLSSTAPSPMPTNYTMMARIGTVVTKQGAGTLLGTVQYGRSVQYVQPQLISSGAQGSYSATAPTWSSKTVAANAGASAFVPLTASQIVLLLQCNLGSGTSANTYAAPNGSYGGYQSANPPPLVAGLANGATAFGPLTLEATTIQFVGGGSASAVYCLGWSDNL